MVLDLFAGTGASTNEYAAAGYDRRMITLPGCDVLTYEPPENVWGIWASPPCQEWSLAKGGLRRDFESALEFIRAVYRIVWQCRLKNALGWWCLENPVGFLRQFLGKPALTVHYWEFGDIIDKPTDLWGYFNFPKKRYTDPPALLLPIQNMSSNQGKTRAITPPCFAGAFFKANQYHKISKGGDN